MSLGVRSCICFSLPSLHLYTREEVDGYMEVWARSFLNLFSLSTLLHLPVLWTYLLGGKVTSHNFYARLLQLMVESGRETGRVQKRGKKNTI